MHLWIKAGALLVGVWLLVAGVIGLKGVLGARSGPAKIMVVWWGRLCSIWHVPVWLAYDSVVPAETYADRTGIHLPGTSAEHC